MTAGLRSPTGYACENVDCMMSEAHRHCACGWPILDGRLYCEICSLEAQGKLPFNRDPEGLAYLLQAIFGSHWRLKLTRKGEVI